MSEDKRKEWEGRRIALEKKQRALSRSRDDAFAVLGRTVYEQHCGDAPFRVGCEEAFATVDEVQEAMAACDQQRADLDAEIRREVEMQRRAAIEAVSDAVPGKQTDADKTNEQERVCAHCGANLSPEAVFCMICGAKVEDMERNSQAQVKEVAQFCFNCGSEVSAADAFCMNCGTKLN